MSDYEKKFITDDYVKGLKKLVERMEELKMAEEEKGEGVDKTEGTDKTEDGEDAD